MYGEVEMYSMHYCPRYKLYVLHATAALHTKSLSPAHSVGERVGLKTGLEGLENGSSVHVQGIDHRYPVVQPGTQ